MKIRFKRKGYNIFKDKKIQLKGKKSYYLLFISMSVLAIFGIYGNYNKFDKLNNEEYQVFNNKVQEDITNNTDTRQDSIAVINNYNEYDKELNFIRPIKGEIINKFSNDKSNYSKTLEMFKIHDGIDIKAKLNDKVFCIQTGKVEKVYKDSFYGDTVVIEHIKGYKSVYSNVESKLKEKEIVNKSQLIGKINNSAIGEIKEEIHLHFGLILNNIPIDPSSKIKF